MSGAPKVGQIVEHYFLWQREQKEGRIEGAKPRPCLIVAVEPVSAGDTFRVTLVPITSQPPGHDTAAIAIPPETSKSLGLDRTRPAWIVLDEANVFVWPGFDLVPAKGGGFVLAVVGRGLFDQLRRAIAEIHAKGRFRATDRD